MLFSVSCKNLNPKEIENEELGTELYNTILAYQAKNKIPKINTKEISPGVKNIKSALIYVYEIKFSIQNKDTIIRITLNSGGIKSLYKLQLSKNHTIYGIYQDDSLKPCYIDDSLKTGNKFIKKYIHNSNLNQFDQKLDFINDEIHDTYLYKVKSKKIIFDQILYDETFM